jgi:SAM-dependent methyltransferase
LANTTTRLVALPGPHAVAVHAVTNRAAFEQVYQMELAGRVQAQQRLNPGTGARFTLRGYCAVCGCEQHFATDFMFSRADANGRLQPAWRERQVCQCQLNARQRSCFHVLADCLGLPEGAVVYCTEQTTELFRHIRCRFPLAVGSEFLGDKIPLGTPNEQGIRNEDITRLTFPDDAFDCVFSIDVLEHVPEYKAGLAELARCLKPGGKLLLTAPFHFGKDTTIVRAGFDADGKLTHYLPPVYHGDPLSTEGCLCFNDFGWDLLDELANAGFTDVALHAFTSEEYGYIGLQYVLLATRQEVLWQRSSRRTLLRHAAPKPPVNRQAELLNEPVETLLQRASAATDQSQWTEAGRLLQALTNRLPDDVGVWQRRVECSRKQGHSVLTDLIVEEALERHPEWQAVLTAS